MQEHVKFRGNSVVKRCHLYLSIHETVNLKTNMVGEIPNYVAGCSNFTFLNGRYNCLLIVNMSDMGVLIEVIMVKMCHFFQCTAQHVTLHDATYKMICKWHS